ncbi:hypothetical protein DY000_02021729 [Brassica cretica]|uniref:Uncharacterized protein n=1 Tax=Brassica cretica TaxID=69181 RepID=A0ABQ7E368_BRACR|nr:hypothetical protein DY000_02021729 [Brassica cretica]
MPLQTSHLATVQVECPSMLHYPILLQLHGRIGSMSVRHNLLVCISHTASTLAMKALPSNKEEFQLSLMSMTWKSTGTRALLICTSRDQIHKELGHKIDPDQQLGPISQLSLVDTERTSIDGMVRTSIDVLLSVSELIEKFTSIV